MSKSVVSAVAALLVMVLFCGCEKVVFDDEASESAVRGNVVLSVAGFEPLNGTARGKEPISDVCTKLSFVIYKDDIKQKMIHQKYSDDNFGTVSLELDEGDYQVLIIGHSGEGKANPSFEDYYLVKFSNITKNGGTGYSDTFYYYGDLTVDGSQQNNTYTLKRATAMFRLVSTDAKPSNVKAIKFLYTGGCGVFDASTGYGSNVNSQQVMIYETPEEDDGRTVQYCIYTFPKEQTGTLSINVRIYDGVDIVNANCLYEHQFVNVPVKRNTITQYTGKLFEEDDGLPIDPTINDEPSDIDEPSDPDDPSDPNEPSDPDEPETPSDPEEPSQPDPAEPDDNMGEIMVITDWSAIHSYTF